MAEPIRDDPPGPGRRPPGLSLVRSATLFYGLVLAAALFWAWWADRSLLYASCADFAAGIDWGYDTTIGLAAALATIALSQLLTRTTRWGERTSRALAGVLGRIDAPVALWLGIVSGVAEEALFRGALQPQVGWVAASLVFGLAHLAPRRELWPWTLTSVAAGFLLGGLFLSTGNLVAPVVTHAVVNAVNLRLLSIEYAER